MKKSQLKEFIKSEIINELSSNMEDNQQTIKDTEELTKATKELGKAKEEAGLSEENMGLADLEEMGYEDGEEAFKMSHSAFNFQNSPDLKSYKKGFFQGFTDASSAQDLSENEEINEMAKISGDLKTAIEKVIQANTDLDNLPLKKAIKANPEVVKALEGDTLYDNQLNKFISFVKGDRVIGQRGRKADPNRDVKPKSPTGSVGRPAKSKEEKDKEKRTSSSSLNKSVTTVKGDEPAAKDIKQAIGYIKKGKKDLRAQEKRKMVKSFIEDMKKEGIISPNGKVEDKEKYDAAWAKKKPEIEDAIRNVE